MFDSLVLCDICMVGASIGVGQVGQEVNIPKVIAVVLLVVTFYRMGNGIIFKLFHFCGYHARPFGEEELPR